MLNVIKSLDKSLDSELKGILFGGDFNAFDSDSREPRTYMKQIQCVADEGFTWLTENISSTFTAYPYDIVFKYSPEDKDEYFRLLKAPEFNASAFRDFCEDSVRKYGAEGGALDHIFYRGFEGKTFKVAMWQNFPSDHAGLMVRIRDQ
jgi:endonuclease/exonuclease/phosphatase (EEP) superfamily protein YafD